jgi:glycosyltransferase involved in cell wall biosynthesis
MARDKDSRVVGSPQSESEDLAQLQARIAVLREALTTEQTLLRRLKDKLRDTDRQRTTLDNALRRGAKHLIDIQKRYDELTNSTFWRLSAPPRYILSKLRRSLPRSPAGGHDRTSSSADMRRDARDTLDSPASGALSVAAADRSPWAGNALLRIAPEKIERFEKQIERLRRKALNLGFATRAHEELREQARNGRNRYTARLAAWRLALLHADTGSAPDAEIALHYLGTALPRDGGRDEQQRGGIIAAECLRRLDRIDEAADILQRLLDEQETADLLLARGNLEAQIEDRMRWIDRAMWLSGRRHVGLIPNSTVAAYDRLDSEDRSALPPQLDVGRHLVTVIVPVFNAAHWIGTALRALLAQSWSNLEVFIVDDCSSDGTLDAARRFADSDERVRVLRTPSNSGPYVARNIALAQARGEFVTCNDADDWSHADKLAVQVAYLLSNPDAVATLSQQARCNSELYFHRRGQPGNYVFANMSSLLFRRREVMERAGFWDSVRFGADGEMLRRLKLLFGEDAVVELRSALLSFQRQSPESLTGNSAFGFPGYFFGARKDYFEAALSHHSHSEALRYEFPQRQRPFPVPEPMWPQRQGTPSGTRHFDVILASDFRLDGGSTVSNLEEIRAQRRFGLRTGLIQMYRYDFTPFKHIVEAVRAELHGDSTQMLVYGERVSCDLLIVRYPPVLQEAQRYLPAVEAASVKVIANQTPMSDYGPMPVRRYHFANCEANLHAWLGKQARWHPIGPLVRSAILDHHREEIDAIDLDENDWFNIIDLDGWRRRRPRCRDGIIRIGRHSRSHLVKWPGDGDTLRDVYPDDPEFEIHVLGGADAPRELLGGLPANWRVWEFGERQPKDFLAEIDVFVYFTHEDWVESFGRVILEAMAVGVPAVVAPVYRPLFGDAALYAQPRDVKAIVRELMADADAYAAAVSKAAAYVESRFGYSAHWDRISPFLKRELT